MCIAKVWLLRGVSKENKVYVSGIGEIPKIQIKGLNDLLYSIYGNAINTSENKF